VVAPRVRPVTEWYERLGVFDLETTGIDVETSRIVSAYVGVIDADGAPRGRSWLADPGVEIPAGASAVHGITTERARSDGRDAEEVVAEIVAVLRALLAQGVPITIYNAPYDLTLLNREAVRYGIEPLDTPFPIIDPYVIDKALDKWRKGKRTLEASATLYGVELLAAHDAEADAVAAGRLAQAIGRKYPTELSFELHELHVKQTGWCAESAADFQEYKRRTDPTFVTSGDWPERLAV
jgi:DNA polymerase-3 subunit epsilon